MPISSGFGRGLSKWKKVKPALWTIRKQSVTPSYSTFQVLEEVKPGPVLEVYATPNPQERVLEEIPIIRQIIGSKRRCCQSLNDADEFQFCDCCGGKCCSSCKCFESMLSCPFWYWVLSTLAFLGLLISLIVFASSPSLLYQTRTVYQTINQFDQINNRTNITVIHYINEPCLPTNTSLTNLTTAYPLCNMTTTRSNVLIDQAVNQVLYASSPQVTSNVETMHKNVFYYNLNTLVVLILCFFL